MTPLHEQWAKDMVQRIMYITIASVSQDGEPWNSPVYAAYDNGGTFYWTSSPESQHSRNISEHSGVFIVIYDSTVPEGTGVGAVYIEARASVIDDPDEIEIARAHTNGRVGKTDSVGTAEQFGPGAVRRVYKAEPVRAWVNTDELDQDGAWLRDVRAEIPLSSLQGLVTW